MGVLSEASWCQVLHHFRCNGDVGVGCLYPFDNWGSNYQDQWSRYQWYHDNPDRVEYALNYFLNEITGLIIIAVAVPSVICILRLKAKRKMVIEFLFWPMVLLGLFFWKVGIYVFFMYLI